MTVPFPTHTFTYGDVLAAARDTSPYFDPTRIPGGTAARMASAVQRELILGASRRDPDMFIATTAVPTASLVPGTPFQLPQFLMVRDIETFFASNTPLSEPTRYLPESRRFDMQQDRGVYVTGQYLNLTGQLSDWATVDHLVVYYVPFVPDFTSETDALTVPDDAKDAFAASLAFRFALRVNGMPFDGMDPGKGVIQLDPSGFAAEKQAATMNWWQRVTQGTRQRRVSNRNTLV